MEAKDIFNIQTKAQFEEMSLAVFRYQYINNKIYQRYCNLLGVSKAQVKTSNDIPYLPIEFFKKETVVSTSKKIQKTFTSSGTTGAITSKHYISDLSVYEQSYLEGFEHFYGAVTNYCVLALLPAYLEREGSSLVYMANDLIKRSKHPQSGFYLNDLKSLISVLKDLELKGQKILLIGVSFALLDVVETHQISLKNTIIMETGGMKGRRKEMIRAALHQTLSAGFGVAKIHSEYGMTELLSQAYSKGDGVFKCPPWMRVSARSTQNPLQPLANNKTGGLNVIDLANFNSCSFIATQDLAKVFNDNSFEVLGRFDHSDVRGCNLLVL